MILQSNNSLVKSVLQEEREIIFIDPTVEDYQSLIAGINPQTKVVILDRMKDGISQISENLQGGKYKSVHIVSHGSEGSLQLGSKQLNSGNLDIYKSQLQQWRNFLTDEADILLYGCDVAAGKTGLGFVQQLSQLTGADVAASDDLTGSAALGGDWDLEVKTGKIEAPLAFQVGVMEAYQYVLPAVSLTNTLYSQNFNGLASSGTSNPWANDTTIAGWYATIATYDAGTGSSTAGTLYSFGSTPTDRALGSVASNNTSIFYGVRLVNNTGSTINSLRVGYTGEQWRTANNTTPQKLNFSYQTGTNVTSLNTGIWTPFSSLDFNAPIANSSASPLDGNLPANRTVIAPRRINLATPLAVGEEIMLRWEDIDDSGFDHGLAIDDFSVQAITSGFTAPTINFSGSTSFYTENATPVSIGNSATVTDDFTDFDAGTLTIRIIGGSRAGDRLSINNQGNGAGQIGLDGKIINFGGSRIGNFKGGTDTEDLVITFETANATFAAVQALLNNIIYSNVAENLPNAGNRTVQVVLKDGDGLSSSTVTRNINVIGQNDAPLIGGTTVLYDSSLGATPDDQNKGLKYYGPGVTPTYFSGTTRLDTFAGSNNTLQAGFSNYIGSTNYTSFTLDRSTGYTVSFSARVIAEARAATANKNNDGKDDRAGFSVIAISSDGKYGIELGFWKDRIWAQDDGTTQINKALEPDAAPASNFRTLFTQAEGVGFNTTTNPVNYDLTVLGDTYTLFADGNAILSGKLRDYSAFPNGILDVYEKPNFIFFGDNTPSARANTHLNRVAVTTNSIPNLTIDEDTTTGPIPFKIRDFETAANSLIVNFSSSNTALIPNNNISYSLTEVNPTRTFTIVPAANQNGTATITMSVSDGITTTQRTFDITVNPVNDRPTFTIGGNQSVKTGTGQQTIAGWTSGFYAGAANESGQKVAEYIVEVINNSGVIQGTPTINKAGDLIYTPSAIGTAEFRVKVRDDGGIANGGFDTSISTTQTFKINVNSTITNSMNGGSSADNLTGTDQSDRISGLDGNDTIYGGLGSDRIFGGNGNDTLYGDLESIPTYGATFSMNDTIAGGNGSDRIYGNLGNDKLYGDEGNDQIWGGDGNDEIWGGAGDDILNGGTGKDAFVLVRNQGKDTIEDFDINNSDITQRDVLGCAGGLKFNSLDFIQQGVNTLIFDKVASQDLALLNNVNASALKTYLSNSSNFRLF